LASTNVTIRGLRAVDNYRQGMSVISVDGLRVSKSVFSGTRGTAPQSGIDCEPNGFDESLRDIVISDCVFADNAGFGVVVSPHAFNASSPVTGVVVTNATFRGNGMAAIAVAVPHPSPGTIVFDGFTAVNADIPIRVFSVAPHGTTVVLKRGSIGVSLLHRLPAITVGADSSNVAFDGIAVDDPRPHPPPFIEVAGAGADRGLSGAFTVTQRGPCSYTAPPGVAFRVTCRNATHH
jgi:hypothetical protein